MGQGPGAASIDYLETRDDIDAERLAYYGVSWGGALGGDHAGHRAAPAVQRALRGRACCFQRALPEVDQINYVTARDASPR